MADSPTGAPATSDSVTREIVTGDPATGGAVSIGVACLGVLGPGLPDWAAARPVLRGEAAYAPSPLERPKPARVPPRERRRMTLTTALAVAVAEQLFAAASALPRGLPAVFACSGGDTEVIDRICRALLLPERPVSPQQFHNSVHNSPAGYWSIACQSAAATISLSVYDASFAAGLLEAAVQIADGAGQALLVSYDTPAPEPIWRFRPLADPFAAALLITAPDAAELALLRLTLVADTPETALADPALEALRCGNPAARSLPLLQAIARGAPAEVVLPYLPGQQLRLAVAPC